MGMGQLELHQKRRKAKREMEAKGNIFDLLYFVKKKTYEKKRKNNEQIRKEEREYIFLIQYIRQTFLNQEIK
jgi:hypothetical protein